MSGEGDRHDAEGTTQNYSRQSTESIYQRYLDWHLPDLHYQQDTGTSDSGRRYSWGQLDKSSGIRQRADKPPCKIWSLAEPTRCLSPELMESECDESRSYFPHHQEPNRLAMENAVLSANAKTCSLKVWAAQHRGMYSLLLSLRPQGRRLPHILLLP